MKAFSQFCISSFEREQETLTASFHYTFDDREDFTETINFSPLKDKNLFPIIRTEKNQIFHLLSQIHIALGVSYYKLFPTKEILVQTSFLNEAQKNFWQEFYLKGLWEFFYQNQIDPRGLAEFSCDASAPLYDQKVALKGEKALVLFWGGKDSLVTVELLKKQGQQFDLFSFGKDYPLHQLAQLPTEKKRLIIQRKIDLPQIQKLLDEGYYNGHVPITGTICFVSLLVAYLYGYQAVITSLEKSADEGNTHYCDMEINHQWSKSSEFEKVFQNYINQWIASDFSLYSPLRKWYEIRIVKEFCQYPQYFHSFSSCNRNFHLVGTKLTGEKLWCWICPKCAFVYTMMRAFLPKEEVIQIFGHDLFSDETLVPLFQELLGISGIKPFECVGTNEEMILAFRLIFQKEHEVNATMIKLFVDHVKSKMNISDFSLLEEKLL